MAARTMTLNLKRRMISLHSTRRQPQVSSIIREFVARHQKVDPSIVRIHTDLNSYLTTKVSRLGRSVTFVVEKVGDIVEARLPSTPKKEEKAEAKTQEAKKEEKPAPAPKPVEAKELPTKKEIEKQRNETDSTRIRPVTHIERENKPEKQTK